MMDLTTTVTPKSDQMNADDLIGRTRTIRVTRVSITNGDDQPVSIYFEGDDGKPFKPCKSMRRVLINAWGPDGNAYTGRRMTLHRDDKVVFGGMAVGGIRISHVSDITRDVTMALTDKRGSRKPYVVKPLPKDDAASVVPVEISPADLVNLVAMGDEGAARGSDTLKTWWTARSADERKALGPDRIAAWKGVAAKIDQDEASDPELRGAA